jgi:hypothetical protein
VHQVGANGRMVLQGADGTLFKEHLENCAPCHNPKIDLTVDPTLTTMPADHPCQVAGALTTLSGCCCVTTAWRGGTWGVWSRR